MRIRRARAFVLAAAAIVSCGKSSGGGGAGGSGDAGLHGPTDLVVAWTLAGKPADGAGCTAHGAAQIFVNLSGTIDPSLHQTTTVPCAMGTVTFSQLLVEKLGNPYLEGTLLDAKGMTVAIAGVDVSPTLGTTTVTVDFFSPQNTGGMTTSSSSSSSSNSSSGTGGTGGSTTGSSSSGGTGGAASSSSSSSASSASSTSSASSASSASSSGIVDAGGGG